MVSVSGMVTIIGMMANDHSRDGDHPWDCQENFDHFLEGDLLRDGDHPIRLVTIIGMVTILE